MPILKNPRWEGFCQEYIINKQNKTQAYLKFYKCTQKSAESNTSQLMGNNGVKERIEELKQEVLKSNTITREELIADLRTIKDRCMQNEPVMEYDRDAGHKVESGEYQFKEAGALKAVELMGKMIAAFTENVNNNISGTIETKPVQVTTGDGEIIEEVE